MPKENMVKIIFSFTSGTEARKILDMLNKDYPSIKRVKDLYIDSYFNLCIKGDHEPESFLFKGIIMGYLLGYRRGFDKSSDIIRKKLEALIPRKMGL